MNRGTARKWVELLKDNDRYPPHLRATGQMRFDTAEGTCFDPFGVLCDFIDPDGWERHPMLHWQHRGEVFKPGPDVRRRAKMKTVWGEFRHNGVALSLPDAFDRHIRFDPNLGLLPPGSLSWQVAILVIETHHEEF